MMAVCAEARILGAVGTVSSESVLDASCAGVVASTALSSDLNLSSVMHQGLPGCDDAGACGVTDAKSCRSREGAYAPSFLTSS